MTRQNKNLQEKLAVEDLTIRNLPEYKRNILLGERIFHQDIRLSLEELTAILNGEGSTGEVALLNGKYIGNAIGFSPLSEQIKEMELHGVKENPGSIYAYNFVINPKFQERGYGTRLLGEFI